MEFSPVSHRWYRFSIRGLMVLTVLVAIVTWLLMPPPVKYHDAVTGWVSGVVPRTWVASERTILNVVYTIQYEDIDGDGRIDQRVQQRDNNRIISWDSDKDGVFDAEAHLGLNWLGKQYYSKKFIRVPVPSTTT